MVKFKKVVNYTREDAWFKQKAWVTPKLVLLGFIAVVGLEYPLALLVFFGLGVYWAIKLLIGLLKGKYTGIR